MCVPYYRCSVKLCSSTTKTIKKRRACALPTPLPNPRTAVGLDDLHEHVDLGARVQVRQHRVLKRLLQGRGNLQGLAVTRPTLAPLRRRERRHAGRGNEGSSVVGYLGRSLGGSVFSG